MNTTFQMKLHDIPFDATKEKRKTIEVRLNDERRKNIRIGDLLEFDRQSGAEKIKTLVLAIRTYNSLEELTLKENFKKTGGIYKDRAHWIAAINSYYSEAEQNSYGLIVFEIEVTY